MRDVALLENRIQEYDWGSHTAIAELLGERTPSVNPQAELWMGAHPRAPSRVTAAGESVSLPDLIAAAPASILGERVERDHAGRLPFLFKLIAAARPLSIQTHPDAAGAREGFERENALGIPLDAVLAQETLVAAQTDLLDAVIGYNKSQVRLLRAIGGQ